MKMTIYTEPRRLVEQNFEAHAASGREQVEEMRRGTATYKGVPIKFGYLPKYFSEEGFAKLKEDLEHTWRILVRVIEEYLEHADYRKMFGFSPELEEMILNRPSYSSLLPVCRLDLFLNEETGEFKFCEFNADGSSAMNENAELYRTYRNTLLCREMDVRYEQEMFELFDSWAETFLGIYRENRPDGEKPAVAIVDFLEKGSSAAEFTAFREAFERAGCSAYVAEIRDMQYEDGRLLTGEGRPVDAVYRRAVTSDILAHREEVQPFLRAVRERKVCLIGDFCTQVVHDKVLFRILHDPRTASFLSPEDNAFIAAHVPYTAMLTKETADRADVRGEKEKWIIKPRDSYGAHGIYPGRLSSEEEWNAQLDVRADTDYILQEFVTPYRTENICFALPAAAVDDRDETVTGAEKSTEMPAAAADNRIETSADAGKPAAPQWQSFSNMTGVYLYGGHLAGIYSRASVTPIISVEGDEHEMTTIVLKKRNQENAHQ